MVQNTASTLLDTSIRSLRVQGSSLSARLDVVRAAELAAGTVPTVCRFRDCTQVATGRLHGIDLCAGHEMAQIQREVSA